MSPERPADQSVDKSARRLDGASERSAAARSPRERRGESWRLLGGRGERAGGPPADGQPEAEINGPRRSEAAGRRHGNPTRLSPSRDSAANYESCLKCRAERCRPPQRGPPADRRGDVGARPGLALESQASSEGARSEEGPGGEGRGGSSKLLRLLWRLLTPLFPSALRSSSLRQ